MPVDAPPAMVLIESIGGHRPKKGRQREQSVPFRAASAERDVEKGSSAIAASYYMRGLWEGGRGAEQNGRLL